MATCERVVKEPVPPPVEYVLRLSESEAMGLRQLLVKADWDALVLDGGILHDVNAALHLAGVLRHAR